MQKAAVPTIPGDRGGHRCDPALKQNSPRSEPKTELFSQQGLDECTRVTYRCESKYPVASEDREMRTERWKANMDCTNASPACRRVNACLSDDALSGGAR